MASERTGRETEERKLHSVMGSLFTARLVIGFGGLAQSADKRTNKERQRLLKAG